MRWLRVKVVGVVSGRRGGNTEILTRIALEEIRKEGLKTELISLAGKKIEPCDGWPGPLGERRGGCPRVYTR